MYRLLSLIVLAAAGCSNVPTADGPPKTDTREQCARVLVDYDRKINIAESTYERASSLAKQTPTLENKSSSRDAAADAGAAVADRAAIEGECRAAGRLD